jgi:outer membrane usher protein
MNSKIKQGRHMPDLRVSKLAYLIAGQFVLMGSFPFNALAREVFNPALLEVDAPHQGTTDLSVFEDGAGQPPGIYHVDIYMNNDLQDTRDVEFSLQKDASGNTSLQPCLSVAELNEMGIKTELFPELGDKNAKCAQLGAIPQARAEFRFSGQQLLLSIPQMAVSQSARGVVPESQWDNGIPAFLLNYSASGANNIARSANGRDNDSQYVNLRPGINLGPWRLRNYTTWSRDSTGQDKWEAVYTYAARSIVSLKSQLVMGDSTSPSDVFDSVPFRGMQLASDDDMLPDSQKGYAPVVRGIARTHAQVIIRQNGYIIYQSYVSAGAFEITDMYPTGGAGDLYVTIKEADGSEHITVVPFASLPVLQREGRLKYSITGGQYRSYDHSVDNAPFVQGTLIYGLPKGFTAYGGSQFADHYQSVALGVGKNLGDFGALSTDVTQAWSDLQNQGKDNGQSWRVRYSKNIVQTGTNLAIAGYRYSTSGFYSLQEAMYTWRDGGNNALLLTERRRNRSEITISQNLWENAGSLSLSWVSENYWNSDRTLRSIGAGYNNSWNGISYGLNYSYNENAFTTDGSQIGRVYDRDQVFSFNINVPLSAFMPNTYASYTLSTSKKGNTTQSVGLNGTALEDKNLSWSVQEGYGSQGVGNSGNINADYRATYGEVTAGYAYDNNTQRVNYGLQGGIVLHENGVTFGQPMGETVALVEAPGAKAIGVINQTGVKTDWRGYAIVPYTSPYRRNAVQLNTETLPDNVDLTLTTQSVVPTRGAVVRARYIANVGQRALMTLLKPNGTPVPFGTMVTDLAQNNAQGFIVGDAGQVYLTGLANSGTLTAKWGNDADQKCQVNFTLAQTTTDAASVQTLTVRCH